MCVRRAHAARELHTDADTGGRQRWSGEQQRARGVLAVVSVGGGDAGVAVGRGSSTRPRSRQ